MIDQATIQRIFDAADIVEVIGEFVNLKRAGQNYRGHSPFTNERTPSFMVSPSKGIFKCFSSGIGGNAVKFLMEHEKITYPEALKMLAKKYNIEVEEKELTADEIKQKNERESLLTVVNYAQKYFEKQLHNTDEGRAIGLSYFKERGFTEKTIERFQLGYSPKQRDAFTTEAQKASYKLEFLTKTGLTIEKGDYRFDRFHDRVMFPIHSISGQVVGFGGRIMSAADKMAKYLNSSESPIYHKGRELYGLYYAKNAISKEDRAYLVEGYTDVLSMHQNGIENVVASSGTALTPDQIRLVKRFTKNVSIIFDGDAAGIKASLRGIDLLLEEGMNVKVLLLPDGEDPDSFAQKHSATDYLQFIHDNERDFIAFKTNLLLKDAQNDPVKKAGLIAEIIRSVAVIPDGITRSVYIGESAKMLEMSEELIYDEVFKLRSKKSEEKAKQEFYQKRKTENVQKTQAKPVSKPKLVAHEEEIISLLLNFGEQELFEIESNGSTKNISVAGFIIQEIEKDELTFEHEIYQVFFNEAVNLYNSPEGFKVQHFITHPEEQITTLAVEMLTPKYDLSKIWTRNDNYLETDEMRLKEIVPEAILAFKNQKVISLISQTMTEIQTAETAKHYDQVQELQQRFIILSQLKQALSKDLGGRIIS